ncbi:MAG: hydroxyquinol 1,2-dioxygenase [SAR86 cluster bacterium]|uniref:Hydroxyquinol 1,2-dioxygenase n=1 Tax=SAR86 cluster bacterium TaxID=2030880 RepID=A0A2A5C642_9GAMM|nr:MAG: hydroxyquinol 1,2-dioxygenase [SAR86 cluster bacterium]
MSVEYKTTYASIDNYNKGGVQMVSGNVKDYVFSNIYEVASKYAPYERVVVAKNLVYTIESCKAEGESPWYTCSHDEFAIAFDYDVEVHYIKMDDTSFIDDEKDGSFRLDDKPAGQYMGKITLNRGHQALLPEKTAYSFKAAKPATLVFQAILGDESNEKWSEICLT